MIRRRILGPVYTVAITLKRLPKSCAGLEDFSTYDRFTNAFSWRQFGDDWYLLVPAKRKEETFTATMYLELPKVVKDAIVRETVEKILEKEFFPKVCAMQIVKVGRAVLVACPNPPLSGCDDDVEFRPESFADIVMHS